MRVLLGSRFETSDDEAVVDPMVIAGGSGVGGGAVGGDALHFDGVGTRGTIAGGIFRGGEAEGGARGKALLASNWAEVVVEGGEFVGNIYVDSAAVRIYGGVFSYPETEIVVVGTGGASFFKMGVFG